MLSCFSRVQLSATIWTVALQAPQSMGLSRQNIAVDHHALLQGSFLTQGSNPCLLHCRWIFFTAELLGEPLNIRILQSGSNNHDCASPAPLRQRLDFPGGTSGKEPACQYRRHKRQGFDPWVRKISWRRAWQPTPVFLPGESR